MPTSVHINEQLALRVQRHEGSVGLSEIGNLIRFYQSNPRVFAYDVIQILDDATVFDFDIDAIPAIRVDFRKLVENAGLPIILHSAWVCPSPRAWSVLEAWLHERHSLDGLHSEPRLVATLDQAGDLFDQDELSAVENMTGFRHYFST